MRWLRLSVRQWELTLEGFIGALSCLQLYLQHCRDIITEDARARATALVLKAVSAAVLLLAAGDGGACDGGAVLMDNEHALRH